MEDGAVSETALYRAYGSPGRLLYVGIAEDVAARMDSHQPDPWYADIAAMDITLYPGRRQAKTAETEAIRAEWPLWNLSESPWACVVPRFRSAPAGDFREQMEHHRRVRRLTRAAMRAARGLPTLDEEIASLIAERPDIPAEDIMRTLKAVLGEWAS
jgi:hypothetical protein